MRGSRTFTEMVRGMEQPLGPKLIGWQAPKAPTSELVLDGRYARLEPLRADAHGSALFRSFEGHDHVWTYLFEDPFSSTAQYHRWVRKAEESRDPLYFAVLNKDSGTYEGTLSYLRIAPEVGSIEVGSITYSPALQRTRAASEAIMLTVRWAFEAGYRRFEWKCNALNAPSRQAAERFGFSFEGIFRQATIVKGRNRDTAWFATIDSEWPRLSAAYEAWLAPSNFDEQGRQRERLSDLTRPVLVAMDPSLTS